MATPEITLGITDMIALQLARTQLCTVLYHNLHPSVSELDIESLHTFQEHCINTVL